MSSIKKALSTAYTRNFDGDIESIRKIYDLFEKGLKEAKNNTGTKSEGVEQYSIGYTTNNEPVAIIDDNILDGVPKADWVKTVKDTISGKFPNGIAISGRLIKVNQKTRNEYTNSNYSKKMRKIDNVIYADKYKSANNLDDIVLASTNYINEDLKHQRKDNFKEFARGSVLIRVDNNDYNAKVIIGFTQNGEMVLYDVIDFTPNKFTLKKTNAP